MPLATSHSATSGGVTLAPHASAGVDAATGLLYVGNGQYYDPSTGRFLTRGVSPDGTNPYVPWNPVGAIVGPLGLISLFAGRKKKGRKDGMFLAVLLMMVTVGMTLSACGGSNGIPTSEAPIPVTATITPDTIVATANVDGQLITATAPNPGLSYACTGGATAIPGGKTAYLTFDDGGYTAEIARSLNEQGMPSTFFVNGDVSAAAASIIKGYGHAVGLHGFIHPVGPVNPASYWDHRFFNVYNDITVLKNQLSDSLGGTIMLRAPGGLFAPKEIFQHSIKWQPYQNAYFYGWDIQSTLGNEPAGLGAALDAKSAPDGAIILLHSNQANTLNAVLDRSLRNILLCKGYSVFKVLPRDGDSPGYDPIGTFSSTHFLPKPENAPIRNEHREDDGITPITWP